MLRCAIAALVGLMGPAAALAQGWVATIDGEPVTWADLRAFAIERNRSEIVKELVESAVLEIELERAGIVLSESDLAAAEKAILERTRREWPRAAALSALEQQLRRRARLERGWDEVLAAENKIQSRNSADDTNRILKLLFIRQRIADYEIRVAGTDPQPFRGLFVEVRAEDGSTRGATYDDAMSVALDGSGPERIAVLLDDLVDSRVVDRELAKAERRVGREEVEGWAFSMSEKHQPPFDWKMICQFKGTTPEEERERWRRVQAWKRIIGCEEEPEELEAFARRNARYFAGNQGPWFRHIFVGIVDPTTGTAGRDAMHEIDRLWEKAVEGADFAWLATRYSDDSSSASRGGLLDLASTDEAIREAAATLASGQVSGPIRTAAGWHLVMRVDPDSDVALAADLIQPEHRGWIRDDLETRKMNEWLAAVRSRTDVQIR